MSKRNAKREGIWLDVERSRQVYAPAVPIRKTDGSRERYMFICAVVIVKPIRSDQTVREDAFHLTVDVKINGDPIKVVVVGVHAEIIDERDGVCADDLGHDNKPIGEIALKGEKVYILKKFLSDLAHRKSSNQPLKQVIRFLEQYLISSKIAEKALMTGEN